MGPAACRLLLQLGSCNLLVALHTAGGPSKASRRVTITITMAADRHFENTLADYKPTGVIEREIPETQSIGTLPAAAAAGDQPVKVPPQFREHSFPSSELFLKAAIDLKSEVNLQFCALACLLA